jgi:flagellar biosynthetic protein FliP
MNVKQRLVQLALATALWGATLRSEARADQANGGDAAMEALPAREATAAAPAAATAPAQASGTSGRSAASAASTPAAAGASAVSAIHPGAPRPAVSQSDRRGSFPAAFSSAKIDNAETAQAVRITLGLTVLALLPALLVSLTPFLRSIIVLSMLRHGLGMNETPPNPVLIGLALFLTLFTMSPVLQRVNQEAFQPFMEGRLSIEEGYHKAVGPLREFMVRQTREQDLALMVELSKAPQPKTMDDLSNVQMVPAYMLSELRSAFQIGFVVLLPFLLIDLVVSTILMALGMMMMPPVTVSLPLKVLMFVLVDGWSLLVKALVGSFI